MPFMKLKLEDLVYSLEDLSVRIDYKLNIAGVYDPGRMCINYNPKRIIDKDDFFKTILHEIIHHVDDEDKLTDNEVEKSAEQNLKNEDLKDYLEMYFTKEVKKYWNK
jgi:hypothetical protein